MQILTNILFILSLTLLVLTVYSIAVDVWLSKLSIPSSHRNEILPKFGVWETCIDDDFCVETANVLHYELKSVTQKKSGWLFMVQLLVTLGTISLGYANIVILQHIVNFAGHGLTYYYIFATTYVLFYTAAILTFASSAVRYFGVGTFKWGISIKLCTLATSVQALTLVAIGVLHAKRHFDDRRKHDDQRLIVKDDRYLPRTMMSATSESSMY